MTGTSFRPKRNQKLDRNHTIVSKAIMRRCGGAHKDEYNVVHAHLRGLRVAAYDLSKGGGEMCDWLVLVGWMPVFFEVKVPRDVKAPNLLKLSDTEYLRSMLKPGEVEFLNTCPAVSAIVTDEDQVYALIDRAADYVFACEEATQKRGEYLSLFFPKIGSDYLPEKDTYGQQD